MNRTLLLVLASACGLLVLAGASQEPSRIDGRRPSDPATTTGVASGLNQPVEVRVPAPDAKPSSAQLPAAPRYSLPWYSVNSGGETRLPGTTFDLGLTAGEATAGFVTGTRFDMGFGFWYGAASAACPIEMSGDVNINGIISASDIIVLVNYVFKAGPEPLPCLANGDVNCNGLVSSSDIITLVISVFKAGPPPCNICDLIPSVWSCP